MRGLKSEDLLPIVDFLYYGEANVYQENLDSFLAVAEELQLKGLMGKTEEKVENIEKKPESQKVEPMTKPYVSAKTQRTVQNRQNTNETESKTTVALSNSGHLDELEQRVQAMMEKSQNKRADGLQKAYTCKTCGKEGAGSAIKEPIEANHLEGIVLPCNQCDKTFRYRNGLMRHVRKVHQKLN